VPIEFDNLAQHHPLKHLFVDSDIRKSQPHRISYLRATVRKGFWAAKPRGRHIVPMILRNTPLWLYFRSVSSSEKLVKL
jgi:hypothetical protein